VDRKLVDALETVVDAGDTLAEQHPAAAGLCLLGPVDPEPDGRHLPQRTGID